MKNSGRTRRLSRRDALTVTVLLGVGTIPGCFPNKQVEDDVKLRSDENVDQEILRVWEDGGDVALSEIVDTSFDDLMVFAEGARGEVVNDAAGFPLISGTYYTSSTQLFLLRAGGRAVDAIMVAADVFDHSSAQSVYDSTVRLVGVGGRELVQLRDG